MNIFLKNLYIGLVTNANVAVYTPLAAGISAKISSASAYNDDTADITLDIYIVPSGGAGAAAASNFIYSALVIPSKKTVMLDMLNGKNVIGAGSLVAKASTTNKITLAVSGVEQTS